MKKTNKVLAISALILGATGLATASGFIIGDAVAKTKTDTADHALVLEWGTTQSVDAITTLTPGNPVYRTISVKAPTMSTGAGVTATCTFTLAVTTDHTLNGVAVAIATADWAVDGTTATSTLTVDTDPAVPSYAPTISADTTYYLKVTITQAAYDTYLGGTGSLGGTLKASYDKTA